MRAALVVVAAALGGLAMVLSRRSADDDVKTPAAPSTPTASTGTVRPGGTVTTTKRDFARGWFDASTSALPQLSRAARVLLVAHGAYESGYGSGFAARVCNNPWNITAGSWWLGAGKAVVTQQNADDDYKPDGTKVRIAQTWRQYATKAEALADYWAFLTTQNGGRYAPAARALERADVSEFVRLLRSGGYFNFPEAGYRSGLSTALGEVDRILS